VAIEGPRVCENLEYTYISTVGEQLAFATDSDGDLTVQHILSGEGVVGSLQQNGCD
jgi:hypothetical protein